MFGLHLLQSTDLNNSVDQLSASRDAGTTLASHWHAAQAVEAAAMPNAVKLWQTALKQLQQLPTQHPVGGPVDEGLGSPDSSLVELLPTVHKFLHSDRVSSAEWKKLIDKLKVSNCMDQRCMLCGNLRFICCIVCRMLS